MKKNHLLPNIFLVFILLFILNNLIAQQSTDMTESFKISKSQNIKEDIGIGNGKITVGIDQNDIININGIWAPPYVSSDFSLTARINGSTVRTTDYTWFPFNFRRKSSMNNIDIETNTLLIPGKRAALTKMTIKNTGSQNTSIDFSLSPGGTLDIKTANTNWGFRTETSAGVIDSYVKGFIISDQNFSPDYFSSNDGLLSASDNPVYWQCENRLRSGNLSPVVIMQHKDLAIVINTNSLLWDPVRRSYTNTISLPASGQTQIYVAFAIGDKKDAINDLIDISINPDSVIVNANNVYSRRIAEIHQKLPQFESGDLSLRKFYDRSLLPLLLNRWDVPEFALNPYYSTGSIKGGCLYEYLWNFGESCEILPLYDPVAVKNHIKQFFTAGVNIGVGFAPTDGSNPSIKGFYPVNQEKIISLVYFYVKNTGDFSFLNESLKGKTILDHVISQALFGDDISKPVFLIDYEDHGAGNSHLELHEGRYDHIMPDLNGRRYRNFIYAAELSEIAGNPRPDLKERAEDLKILLKVALWDKQKQWFKFQSPDLTDYRYTVQMFYLLGSGVLDDEMEAGLLSHLNGKEFLSDFGLHSLSKLDPAYHLDDIDNGGPGSCTSFPLNIATYLYRIGAGKKAEDILKRILWWGERVPYWGDSFVADRMDYRKDTPLQCTIDAISGVQCIVFGMFGITPEFDGSIKINPHPPGFARQISLRGIKIRGHVFDVIVNGSRYEVHSGSKTIRANVGRTVVISSDD